MNRLDPETDFMVRLVFVLACTLALFVWAVSVLGGK